MENTELTKGLVDSGSIHGVMAALSCREIDQWPPWTLRSATEVTCSLITNKTFEVAPSLEPYSKLYGLFGHTMLALSPVVRTSRPDKELLKRARSRVKTWAARNPLKIKQVCDETRADKSYAWWEDWTLRNVLPEHTAMLSGLFDEEFIPQLSNILNCPKSELGEILERSRDSRNVEYWSKKRPNTDDFKLLCQAYLVSSLLRGRYHDHIAEAEGIDILHHPIRDLILPKKKVRVPFIATNTEMYLISIILSGALVEKEPEDRLSLWAEGIIKARNGVATQRIVLSHRDNDSMAREVAMEAAKIIDLRLYSNLRASCFDVLSAMLIDGFVSLVLCPWTGIPPVASLPIGPAIVAHIQLKSHRGVGDQVASSLSQRRAHLCDLAEAIPGRILGSWLPR